MGESVVTIRNLSKTYRPKKRSKAEGFQALKDVSLDIHKGEIFGLLGPNGAGKTTLINIVSGLTRRTAGEVLVFGKDVDKDYRFTRRKIGLVQQEISFDPFLTVEETLKMQAGYFGLRNADARIGEILQSLSLQDKKKAAGRALSGGMKRRVMIAKALVHDPDIIFLDEPTAGVDVELREQLWALVRKMRDSGKTIILTTHYLEEAEQLASRIGIINGGTLLLVEEKEKLLADHGAKLSEIYLKHIREEIIP